MDRSLAVGLESLRFDKVKACKLFEFFLVCVPGKPP